MSNKLDRHTYTTHPFDIDDVWNTNYCLVWVSVRFLRRKFKGQKNFDVVVDKDLSRNYIREQPEQNEDT